MKNNKVAIVFLASFILMMLVSVLPAEAQCSLCQSQVESSLSEGNTTAKALNNGIFILLVSPYILIGTIVFIWYRRNQKAKALAAENTNI